MGQADITQVDHRRRFSPRFIAGMCLCVLLAAIWRWVQSYPLPLFDLYPLYYGASAWWHTHNAYVLDQIVPASDRPFLVFRIGNGYPLPAVLLILPLTWFSPHVAATIWVGLLTAGLLFALRLNNAPFWLLLYVPLLEGLRIEQYTVFIIILQIIAVWAYRERRLWILALCCALIVTKPTQGGLFVLVMLFLARHWRQQLVAMAIIWGGTLLLDPNWIAEWLAAVRMYAGTANQPILWPIALLAIPLILLKDVLGATSVLQVGLSPFPGVYAAGALPLGVLNDNRTKWLSLVSFLWPLVAVPFGKPWATALTLVLPLIFLALIRWRDMATESSVVDRLWFYKRGSHLQ